MKKSNSETHCRDAGKNEITENFGTETKRVSRDEPEPLNVQETNKAPDTLGPPVANRPGSTEWAELADGSFLKSMKSIPKLPTGVYRPLFSGRGERMLCPVLTRTDDLIRKNCTALNEVLAEIEKFWRTKDKFKKHGYLHKRGILLWGQQGCGKSALVCMLAEQVVDLGGIVLHGDTVRADRIADFLIDIRSTDPERPLVCVLEDIDAIVENSSQSEHGILMLLDGLAQIDNVLYLATTNFPERLNRRIVSRPRRFDRLIQILPPDSDMRRAYFEDKQGIPEHYLDEWVEKSEGLSFASLAEICVSVLCLDNDLEETVNRLKLMEAAKTSSDDYAKQSVGFRN